VTATRALREPLIAFAAATAAIALLALLGTAVPLVRENLHGLIALVFYATPAIAAKRAGRELDYREAGLRGDPVRTNIALVAIAVAVTFPAFVVGFFVYYGRVCAHPASGPARLMGGLCGRWLGLAGGRLRLPPQFPLLALSQLVVVAVPEELFFRGYLLERLEQVWPARRRFLGAPVGAALVVSSALFALGHVIVIPNPQRLAVFFPALLFGWMRARTGSIAPGAVFHALCNVLADVLHTSYFG
jgi:hypothetical protein